MGPDAYVDDALESEGEVVSVQAGTLEVVGCILEAWPARILVVLRTSRANSASRGGNRSLSKDGRVRSLMRSA